MLEITNVKVYDLEESVIACRNAMRLIPPQYTKEEFKQSLLRAIQLSRCGGGSGHSNFRIGIRVSFDITYPQYFSPELQRYHFNDIVTSSSKMHRLMNMDLDVCCNEYVTKEIKDLVKGYIAEYNTNKTYDNFMKALSNAPLGLELFMRCTTNYECLATIYKQRKYHRLKEWSEVFCSFIQSLPYANELIICTNDNKENN